ncbi:MAG: rhomboid family intramembrane serine protease [Hyphomicrobium sp.]
MFVPLHDENGLRSIRFQYVTVALIAINLLVYIFEQTGLGDALLASFALIPSELLGVGVPGGMPPEGVALGGIPEPATLLSYMFFHGSLYHLAGNMLFLWVFGDNVEDAMGHAKFLVFYLACGIFAGLTHTFIANSSLGSSLTELAGVTGEEPVSALNMPLIGASGAVAGVIAAYLMLHPRVRVWVLAFNAIPLRISAAVALGAWVVMQIVMVVIPQSGPVAWWAHIGGLVAGAVLVFFLRRRGVPLFDKGLHVA